MEPWIHIYDLPTVFRKEIIVKQLVGWVNEVMKVEVDVGGFGGRDYLNVHVKMDMSKPLIRVLKVAT